MSQPASPSSAHKHKGTLERNAHLFFQAEIDIPRLVVGLDTESYNRAASTAIARDIGGYLPLTERGHLKLNSLLERFPYLAVSQRSRVVVTRALLGMSLPEDLARLVDPASPLAVVVPLNEYHWESINGRPPRFHRVQLSRRELNSRIMHAFSELSSFTVAWNVFAECVAWGHSDMAFALTIFAATNWHLQYLFSIARQKSWLMALEYHLLVHRQRITTSQAFDPNDWYQTVDETAYLEALRNEEARSSSPTYSR